MNDDTPLTEAQARQRRQEALRALAAQQQQQSAPAPSVPAPASAPPASPAAAVPSAQSARAPATDAVLGRRAPNRRRIWIPIVAALLALAVVAAGTLFWLRRPAAQITRPVPAALPISLDSQTQCPQQALWAPDAAHLAVLGYQTCGSLGGRFVSGSGNAPSSGGLVLLYAAESGQLTKSIQLDPTIIATVVPALIRNDPVAMASVGSNYYTLVWSPDGKQMAVGFDIYHVTDTAAPGNAPIYGAGLAVIQVATGAVKVLPQSSATPQAGGNVSSFQPQPALLWDLQAGSATRVQVPQALSYHWGPGGSLTPAVALPTTPDAPPPPAPTGPVGNPIGGAQFSAWQTGYASYGTYCTYNASPADGPASCCPITAFYQAGFFTSVAWSPDGRYLLHGAGTVIGAYGKIAITLAPSPRPLPAGCANAAAVSETLAQLPVRDKALSTVLQRLSPQPQQTLNAPPPPSSGPTNAAFTWSPDGKRLAVQLQDTYQQSPNAPVLEIIDCASGRVLAGFTANQILTKAQVPLNVLYDTNSVGIQSFAWSADSQRLMLLGAPQPFVLILGPKALGI